MQVGAAVERMGAFQAQLHDLLDQSARALALPEADTAALAAFRWRLVRTLREYQLFKHTEIYDPLIGSADRARSEVAAALKNGCEAMGDAYGDHIRRWSLSGTGPASPDYGADARRMIRLVNDHLAREDVGIRRLLAGLERTRGGRTSY